MVSQSLYFFIVRSHKIEYVKTWYQMSNHYKQISWGLLVASSSRSRQIISHNISVFSFGNEWLLLFRLLNNTLESSSYPFLFLSFWYYSISSLHLLFTIYWYNCHNEPNIIMIMLQPYRTLCGFPTNDAPVSLLVPNRMWRPDTVICDTEGTEWFVLMECDDSMRSYEAIFGDMHGHKMVCVRRKMMKQVWNDGFYICTYKPNFPNQPPLYERDCNNSTCDLACRLFLFACAMMQDTMSCVMSCHIHRHWRWRRCMCVHSSSANPSK